ncbi:MAG: hypothetical protein LAO55_25975 [Acidobacteriia bacterium]|nr:hypothetical protein [Terriglobia bacterium]
MANKNWLDLLVAASGPIAAAVAVFIAWWQAHIQHQQLKVSLYQKRLEVYLHLRKFLSDVTIRHTIDFEKCMQLMRDTKEAEFLFDQGIDAFITLAYRNATELRTLEEVSKVMHREKISELERWFVDAGPREAAQRFSTYLQLYKSPFQLRSRQGHTWKQEWFTKQ